MRILASGSVAAAVVCAALAVGAAAPTGVRTVESSSVSTQVPATDAAAILRQTATLGEAGGLVTPVANLIESALTADGGKLSGERAQRYLSAVTTAIANVSAAKPGVPAAPEAATKGAAVVGTPAELKADALDEVRKSAEALAAAATAGNAADVVTQAQATVASLVKFVVATVLTGGLPAPKLPGLPTVPPAAGGAVQPPKAAAPAVPVVPQAPAATPATPAAPAPAASAAPAAPAVSSSSTPAAPAVVPVPSVAAAQSPAVN
jgi:hypothetical protein